MASTDETNNSTDLIFSRISKDLQGLSDQVNASATFQNVEGIPHVSVITSSDLFSAEFVELMLNSLMAYEAQSGLSIDSSGLDLSYFQLCPLFDRLAQILTDALKQRPGGFHLAQDAPPFSRLEPIYAYAIKYVAAPDPSDPDARPAAAAAHPWHVDQSVVTLNLCLGAPGFEGGELVLDAGYQVEPLTHRHQVGVALIHPGAVRHCARPLRAGQRYNLICWFTTPETATKEHRRRFMTIKEMMETEETYSGALITLISQFSKLADEDPRLAPLFTSAGYLTKLHTELLVKFAELYDIIEPLSHKEESAFDPPDSFVLKLGEIRALLSRSVELSGDYIINYRPATEIIETNANLQALLTKIQSEMGVFSYLIIPLRRIPRYSLLFNDLDKHIAPEFHTIHPSTQRVKAVLADILKELKQGAHLIDECVRQSEQQSTK